MPDAPAPAGKADLPLEPGSSSELLAAATVMLVDVVSIKESPWGPGPSGQMRRLDLTMKLMEVFKGKLDLAKGKTFELSAEQHRVGRNIIEDVPGLWSHEKPAKGMTYLVLSASPATAPAEVMKEESVRGLLKGSLSSDAALAAQAESKSKPDAGREKLAFAKENRAGAHDLFARYLWARVKAGFSAQPAVLLPDVLALITAKDAPADFRSSLISELSAQIDLLEVSPELRGQVVRACLTVLLQKEAEDLHESLVQNGLPGLIFQEEKAVVQAAAVVPDAGERARLKAAAKTAAPRDSKELIDWLDGK